MARQIHRDPRNGDYISGTRFRQIVAVMNGRCRTHQDRPVAPGYKAACDLCVAEKKAISAERKADKAAWRIANGYVHPGTGQPCTKAELFKAHRALDKQPRTFNRKASAIVTYLKGIGKDKGLHLDSVYTHPVTGESCSRQRHYQVLHNIAGFCGTHRTAPLAPGSKSQCQRCIDEARGRYRKFQGNKPIFQPLLTPAEKDAARLSTTQAVNNGTLKKKPCAVCDSPQSEAHHFDYRRPLEIIWLCRRHHAAVHAATAQHIPAAAAAPNPPSC